MLRSARLSLRVYLPALIFPNSGNMGMPLCLFAFGETGLGLAMVFFAVLAVAQFTLGVTGAGHSHSIVPGGLLVKS